jgi:tetratricopeptide (TPR) repeat protein
MPGRLVDDLRERLGAGRVVVVAGSGVTAAATDGHELSSWSGLVASGIEHAQELGGVEQARLDAARLLLGVGDSSALISAAELVSEMLGGRDGGEYARWLQETVGSLELVDRSVPEALLALGAPVATTNYDDLIKKASPDLERVTWIEGGAVLRALQGDDRAVVHLHGHWREPRSVVLGVRSYEELGRNGPAQALQRAMATMGSLLFVGVGDGASDPNFGALRKWLVQTFPDNRYRHFRLCLNGEVEALGAEHDAGERVFPVGYGDSHDDLADFLRGLAPAAGQLSRVIEARGAMSANGVVLPAPPVTFGREEQIAEVTTRLLAEPAQPVLLLGAPGIGKTNLTLAALHDPEVVARFPQCRWMVRCETTQSAAGLAGEIATTLGVPPGGDVLGGILTLLARAPAVLALDNLETPWEHDTLAVEELLGRLAAVAGTALIASVRGSGRPSGVRWAHPTSLQPLDPASAKSLFASIAPSGFGDAEPDRVALDGLLEEMGGIPLAVELLAYAAEGEPSLAHLAERWKTERAHLLQRGSGDHRLLSIAVSLDTSLKSPAMNDSAKRLLSILGKLPDGIADEDLETLMPGEGPAAANLLRRRGLALEQAGRLRTLPPVRHHLSDAHPPAESDWQRAIDHYCKRAETLGARVGRTGGGEAISTLSREAANITIVITHSLLGEQREHGYAAARAFIGAARFSGVDAAPVSGAFLSAAECSNNARLLADASFRIGILTLSRSDRDGAWDALMRAQPLFEQVGDVLGQANCIQGLGDIALRRSDYDAARDAFVRAQPLYEQAESVLGQANCIQSLGDIALRRSDYDAARDALLRAQPLFEQVGSVLGQANCIQRLGDIALRRSDYGAARDAFVRAQPLFEQIGEVLGQANCILGLGDVALGRSDPDAARDTYKHALQLYAEISEFYSLGAANCRLARLENDPVARCAYVSEARKAWMAIKRDDLVAELTQEFTDCV